MTRTARALAILCSGLPMALTAGRLEAQDDRYWRLTYGTEATMLNGAVIGRATDVGTIFYNPAGLADLADPSVLISGNVYEYEKITAVGYSELLDEPVGTGTGSIRPAPSFFGGTIPWKALGKHRLGYSVLTRQRGDTRTSFRDGIQLPQELVQLEALNFNDMNEVWVGPTWAYAVSNRVSIGASLFVAVRSQYLRSQLTGQTLDDATGEVGVLSTIREFDYNSWRVVPKLGATWKLNAVTLGATVTIPSLGLWGSGTALYNNTTSGIDFDGDNVHDPAFTSNFQEGVKSDFHTSWAAGLGAAVDVSRATTLFLSAEWYDAVQGYDVLETAPFTSQLSGVTYTNPLIHQTRSVVNVAGGVRHRFSPKTSGYLSGATDLSAADTTFSLDISKALWDLYTVTGGVQLLVGRTELVLGLGYIFGGATVPIDTPAGVPSALLDEIEFSQHGLRAIFGFQYSFGTERNGGARPAANAP